MKRLIILLILASFFNALSWIVLIPVWQYPDEQAHFAQVQNTAEFGQNPKDGLDTSYEIAYSEKVLQTERDGFGNNKFTYHPEYKIDYADGIFGLQEEQITSLPRSARIQLVKNESTVNPPLYYFFGSLAYKLFSNGSLFTRVFAVRFISLIFFLVIVFLSYQIAKLVFERNKTLQIALPTFVAFKPMLIFASTGVLPDSLTNLLFTAVLFLCLKIIKVGFNVRTIVLLSLTVLLGVLTRQQFLISVFIILAAILCQAFKKLSNLKWIFASLVAFLALFYFSNTVLISMPIFTNFRVPEIFDAGFLKFGSLSLATFTQHFVWTLRHTFSEVWPWYWGVYRWLSYTLPPIYYQIINRLVLISLMGLMIKIFFFVKDRKIDKQDIHGSFLIVASLIYFLVLTVWDYLFWVKNGFSFGIQGRYFFPLITAHMGILLLGFWQIFRLMFKKYASIGIYALILFFIFFNNFSLFYVASSYYDISNLSTFIKQVSQYKPLIIKGNTTPTILLLSFTFQLIFIFSLGKYIIKRNVST